MPVEARGDAGSVSCLHGRRAVEGRCKSLLDENWQGRGSMYSG